MRGMIRSVVEQLHTERGSLTVVIWISGAMQFCTAYVLYIAQCVIGCRRNAENSEYAIWLGLYEWVYSARQSWTSLSLHNAAPDSVQ